MATEAIRLESLSKTYGPITALGGVNLAVGEGEVFGFLGPNGAGKTTAIRILFDLIRPTSGVASVMGIDCQKRGVEARAQLGYMPGDLRLYDGFTGQQHVDLFASLRGVEPEPAYVKEVCERLSLDLTKAAGSYSRGNRQKLGLVLARPRACFHRTASHTVALCRMAQ